MICRRFAERLKKELSIFCGIYHFGTLFIIATQMFFLVRLVMLRNLLTSLGLINVICYRATDFKSFFDSFRYIAMFLELYATYCFPLSNLIDQVYRSNCHKKIGDNGWQLKSFTHFAITNCLLNINLDLINVI